MTSNEWWKTYAQRGVKVDVADDGTVTLTYSRGTAELDLAHVPDVAAVRLIAQECLETVAWVTALGVDLQGLDCHNSSIFVPAFDVRQAAQHKRDALAQRPDWVRLNRVARAERAADGVPSGWYNGVEPCTVFGDDLDCDEFPYYSTAQSGPGASLRLIDPQHNQREGSLLNSFYNVCDVRSGTALANGGNPFDGDPFLVLPMPTELPNTVFFCDGPVDHGPPQPT